MADKNILDASILIVDDQETNVALMEQVLRSAGYTHLTSTRNPREVCQLHRKHGFDLILLDIEMPAMDGFAVMEALGKIEPDGYFPVLAITVEPGHKLRALAAGAKDFILKPFDLAELKTRIHNLLEVRLLYQQLKTTVNTLESFALHDALTGLPNRRLLQERLQQARLSSARTLRYCALMFLDLDHFKQLNDTLGHDAGDLLLKELSARLLLCVREGDSVARFGGDEFVVLLDALSWHRQNATSQAQAIALKILQTLGQTYDLAGQSYDSSVSIGIVIFVGDAEPVAELLKKADLAMYQAKSCGRNQACIFDPAMQADVLAQEALTEDLRQGLADQAFMLHYQIQVDASGCAVGAEALLRWNHPCRGLMEAADFLPLAEETGIILPLGQWVLETACRQLLLWAGDPACASWTLAINVGACQLAQADFCGLMANILQATGVPVNRLTLELTEGTLVNNVEDVIGKMNTVNALGVAICLEELRAGFPSLEYLRRLPLAQLKIEQAMVQTALTDDSVAVMARAIVDLGKSLGLSVIADCVETAAQRDFFAGIGCDAFQGNYFGAPAAAPEMFLIYKEKQALALMGKA